MTDVPATDAPVDDGLVDSLGHRLDALIVESREQAARLRVALLEAVADLDR